MNKILVHSINFKYYFFIPGESNKIRRQRAVSQTIRNINSKNSAALVSEIGMKQHERKF